MVDRVALLVAVVLRSSGLTGFDDRLQSLVEIDLLRTCILNLVIDNHWLLHLVEYLAYFSAGAHFWFVLPGTAVPQLRGVSTFSVDLRRRVRQARHD